MTAPQPPPLVLNGQQVISQPAEWTYELHPVGIDNATGEKIFVFRVRTHSTLVEVWAPGAFLRQLRDAIDQQTTGLTIARDVPPNGQVS